MPFGQTHATIEQFRFAGNSIYQTHRIYNQVPWCRKVGDAKVIRHHPLNWNSRNQSTIRRILRIGKRRPHLRLIFSVDSPQTKHILRSGSLRVESRDQQRAYTAFHVDDNAICGTFANLSGAQAKWFSSLLLLRQREWSIFAVVIWTLLGRRCNAIIIRGSHHVINDLLFEQWYGREAVTLVLSVTITALLLFSSWEFDDVNAPKMIA